MMQAACTVRQQEWLGEIEAQRQSGLSQRAWCLQRGIAAGTFAWWKHRLSALLGRPAIGFIDVVVSEPPPPIAATIDIVLRESGHRVVVGHGFDEQTLLRLVAVLEGRP